MNLTHLETLLAAATPGPWYPHTQDIQGNKVVYISNGPGLFSEPPHAVVTDFGKPLTGSVLTKPDGTLWPAEENAELITALRNAAPALIARIRELEEWQPIETAAKDGTRILVKDDEGEIFTANWDSGFQEWYVIGDHTSLRFTHWRSLP